MKLSYPECQAKGDGGVGKPPGVCTPPPQAGAAHTPAVLYG